MQAKFDRLEAENPVKEKNGWLRRLRLEMERMRNKTVVALTSSVSDRMLTFIPTTASQDPA